MLTLADSLLSSSARKIAMPQAAGPFRPAAAVPGPRLLGGQGPDRAELLPLPGRGVRHPADARRRREPGRDQGPVRGAVPAAEDHAGRAAAVPGHAAPQRAGRRRRPRPGPATGQTPPRAPPQGDPRPPSANILCLRFKGIRSRAAAERLQPLRGLVLQAAGGRRSACCSACRP